MESGYAGPAPEVTADTLKWLGLSEAPSPGFKPTKANTFASHHPAALQQLPELIQVHLPFAYYADGDGGCLVDKTHLKIVRELALRGSSAEVAKVLSDVHHQMYYHNELERCLLSAEPVLRVQLLQALALSLQQVIQFNVLLVVVVSPCFCSCLSCLEHHLVLA